MSVVELEPPSLYRVVITEDSGRVRVVKVGFMGPQGPPSMPIDAAEDGVIVSSQLRQFDFVDGFDLEETSPHHVQVALDLSEDTQFAALDQRQINHQADPVDAHDASAISFAPTIRITSANVQDAINEVQVEALQVDARGAPNGVASLDPIGKVPQAQLPLVAFGQTFFVDSEAEMLALSQAVQGDLAVRSDTEETYILTELPPSDVDNWFVMPGGSVSSVNGRIGAVSGLEEIVRRGVANGYASLDEIGKVPDAQIPDAISRDSEVTAAVDAAIVETEAYSDAALTGHVADTSEAHEALGVIFDPTDTLAATNVQDAIEQLELEIASVVTSSHPNVAAHDALGLATDADLTAHETAAGVPEVLYVNPTTGSDSNHGKNWNKPYATVVAAYAALPSTGGTIILSNGRHDVYNGGNGLLLTTNKFLRLRSVDAGLGRRNELPSTLSASKNAILYSSGGALPYGLVNFHFPGGTIHSGGHFKGVVFDMTNNTPYGIYASGGWNEPVVEDCSFAGPESITTEQYAIRTANPDGDSSWWRITNNHMRHVGIANMGAGGNCNQHIIRDNVCFTPGTDAIRLKEATRCVIRDNNLEGVPSGSSAIYMEDCRGCLEHGDAGEASAAITFVKAVNCTGCTFAPIGTVGSGAALSGALLIDDDNANTFLTTNASYSDTGNAYPVRTGTAKNNAPPVGGFVANRLVWPHLASIPVGLQRDRGPRGLTHRVSMLSNASLTAEYWDGAAWTAWSPTNLAALVWENTDVVTVDTTHKRFRLMTGNVLTTSESAVLHARFAPVGAASRSYTMQVERLSSAGAVLQTDGPFTKGLSQTLCGGVAYPITYKANQTALRIEFDFSTYFTNGGGSFSFKYLGVESDAFYGEGNVPWDYRGSGTPEGVVRAVVGSTYRRTNGGAGTTVYVKETGTGTTGWVALGGGGGSVTSFGAPTGTPDAGTTLYEVATSTFWLYDGSAWKGVGLG